ncbi:LacI family transcriptional regulator [Luteimicrobium album]|uniref:LacI family transcriptional regulator n=1 Tax=Luteimicrobium album TaxID=1054550 RepID=A0ABQ6HWK3_9MICO|nr:LacI family DNA-binding transcriptional regulator [Luteimicrobium album]GMA22885.1 LacI family transcriptional regulator [Luteimicrobium album]
MLDVARLAGVSQQTVSRVVNDHPNVSDDVRQRVEEAIQRLGYRRNSTARALATNRTMGLGVVCFALSVNGPADALFGVTDEARRRGYSTHLTPLDDLDRASLQRALDQFRLDAVDGVVVLAPMAEVVEVMRGISVGLPIAVFEQGMASSASSVGIDDVYGAQLATRHLIELGHREVLHIAGPVGWMASDARARGWDSELRLAERTGREMIRADDWSAAAGYAAGRKYLERSGAPTAVLAASDRLALGFVKALHEAGVRVPDDVSVVGFDDIAEAGYFEPALTTVHFDFVAVGREAVARVVAAIDRTESTGPDALSVPELVVRSSTAPPRRTG